MQLTALRVDGTLIRDGYGRSVLLRGVNLGGDCKVPYPDGGTHIPSDFSNHRSVSFTGRPFPLSEAAVHLDRLRSWGFNCLRLLTTWEAVEHAGPGQYDQEYLDYYAEVCRLAGERGFYIFVDFHQDVWSRFTGGDGAPGWVLEELGFDLAQIAPTHAAIVMQQAYDYSDPRPVQEDKYPTMVWSANYRYPLNGLLWALFFAGRAVAPHWEVRGQNVQDFLQGHYLGANVALARVVRRLPNVIGFDTLNEPSAGWIGTRLGDRRDRGARAERGPALSPAEALAVMNGWSVRAPFLDVSFLRGGLAPVRRLTLNPERRRLWREGVEDPFVRAGVWRPRADGSPEILDETCFYGRDGRPYDFEGEFLLPFFQRVADAVRAVRADWIIFYEKPPTDLFHKAEFPEGLPENSVNASHWYDLLTLVLKRFLYPISLDVFGLRPVFGRRGVQRMYERQLARLKNAADRSNHPALIGEFGIPYDLDNARAFRAWRSGDRSGAPWRRHALALELMYNALDRLLLHSTHWNYTATNRNDQRIGDNWNQEDLSIYSRDQETNPADPASGARAGVGFIRPYARAVQGRIVQMSFDTERGRFTLEFDADASLPAPTEIYVPRLQYPRGYDLRHAGLRAEQGEDEQFIKLYAERPGIAKVEIVRL